ncbi:Uu.00g106470.m01.CDS01 [Anthostomella pinea]|uniref:Uu.00g106470.m01.CDS01 n=1 Tax=Anthostomella pinea TaxID=933095 RepID=A0AAI8YFT3_9PEZI|nr:Uu.00g106470.m01.CDS01 [Anthostomella pinea]
MAQSIQSEADAFIKRYAALFSSPCCSSPDEAGQLADEVGKHYRPGVTFFTNGEISRFESQSESARFVEGEMRKNIESGVGTRLDLLAIHKTEVYSPTSALCWLEWEFVPKAGSEYGGKSWKFTNIYGYRAATKESAAGWEFVVRDDEVNAFVQATGKTFEA